MSRSKLEHLDSRKKNYDQDLSHFDQQYAAYTQDTTVHSRLAALEHKFSQIDLIAKNQALLERKLEELALQFDKYLCVKDDPKLRTLEDKYDLLSQKVDKSLLILHRDIHDMETQSQIQKYIEPQFRDLEMQVKNISYDLQDIKNNFHHTLRELVQDNDPKKSLNLTPDKFTRQKEAKKDSAIKRQKSENPVALPQQQLTQSNDYDETRRRIDEEINRRIQEENEKRKLTIQKESEQEASKFKHTPLSTEKSRSKEIQNRLNLERKTKQEKINQLNDLQQYKQRK